MARAKVWANLTATANVGIINNKNRTRRRNNMSCLISVFFHSRQGTSESSANIGNVKINVLVVGTYNEKENMNIKRKKVHNKHEKRKI